MAFIQFMYLYRNVPMLCTYKYTFGEQKNWKVHITLFLHVVWFLSWIQKCIGVLKLSSGLNTNELSLIIASANRHCTVSKYTPFTQRKWRENWEADRSHKIPNPIPLYRSSIKCRVTHSDLVLKTPFLNCMKLDELDEPRLVFSPRS